MDPSAYDVGQLIRSREAEGPVPLLAVLAEIQERYHYLPHHALVLLSETLDLPLAQIYSVATFYNAYSLKPRGAHLVRVCMGTACHVPAMSFGAVSREAKLALAICAAQMGIATNTGEGGLVDGENYFAMLSGHAAVADLSEEDLRAGLTRRPSRGSS